MRQQSEEARDEGSRQIMVCIAGLRHRTDALAVLLAERSPIIPVLRSDIETLYVWSTSTPYEETPDGRWQFSVPLGDDVLNEARRLLASYE